MHISSTRARIGVTANIHLQPEGVASGKARRFDPKIPLTRANWVNVPSVPRNVGGASSPRYMGITTEENLLLRFFPCLFFVHHIAYIFFRRIIRTQEYMNQGQMTQMEEGEKVGGP